jgi:hypothetical protein
VQPSQLGLRKENPVFRLPFKADLSVAPFGWDSPASFWRSKLILHGVDIQLEEVKDDETHKEGYVGIRTRRTVLCGHLDTRLGRVPRFRNAITDKKHYPNVAHF